MLLKYWIIGSNLIITKHNHRLLTYISSQFCHILYPQKLTFCMSHGTIFCNITWSCYYILFLASPCNKDYLWVFDVSAIMVTRYFMFSEPAQSIQQNWLWKLYWKQALIPIVPLGFVEMRVMFFNWLHVENYSCTYFFYNNTKVYKYSSTSM